MQFTRSELAIIHNSDFFYTKLSIITKIDSLLAQVRDALKQIIKEQNLVFPKEVDVSTGKIFRGENYRGLPYLNLDYPKYFSNDSVITCRTLFWWGNFFSFTIHLQGKALDNRRKLLIQHHKELRKRGIYFCVNHTPWQYHYQPDNYILYDKLREEELKSYFAKNDFIKLSGKIALKDYQKLPDFSVKMFTAFSFLFGPQANQSE